MNYAGLVVIASYRYTRLLAPVVCASLEGAIDTEHTSLIDPLCRAASGLV